MKPARRNAPPTRVILWGTCDTGKPRVRILRDGLRANGIELLECRADVWGGIQDKSQVRGAGRWLGLLLRVVFAYPALVWRYLRLPRHDWVLLGYPAIPDIFVIRLFAWLRGAHVAMDWFLSAYDTVVMDRRMVGRRHPLAWVLWTTEWLAVRLADRVFMDTKAHARRMEQLFGLPRGRCGSVWVGVEDGVFSAPAGVAANRDPARPLQVLFYGQFIPLHGVPTIIEAARLLRDAPVEWLLIGRGQEAARVRAMLDADPLSKVRWLEWVDYHDLTRHIDAADLCLGIFGMSDKAASVIPNKVFQVLAAGKPLVTRDSPAIRELLDGDAWSDALVPAGDAAALAAAVMRPGASRILSGDAASAPLHSFTTAAIGRQFLDLLAHDVSPATSHQ